MLIFSTITPPFKPLVERWLGPSLRRLDLLDQLIVIVDHDDAARGNGNFRTSGFDAHVVNKLALIGECAAPGKAPFLVTDADVVYLLPFQDLLNDLLEGNDILLAREYPNDDKNYNIGQMAIRPSTQTADFFRQMASDLRSGRTQARYRRDQPANQDYINEQLRKSGLRHAPLPETFTNTALLRHLGGQPPVGVHAYHATGTLPQPGITSLEKKHAQLADLVRRTGFDLSQLRD